jgi:hypothetical protein
MPKRLLFALFTLVLAACAAPASETAAPPTSASTLAVADAAAAATKTPRLHLEATDPATVSLAAGKPQLVEFFAFW